MLWIYFSLEPWSKILISRVIDWLIDPYLSSPHEKEAMVELLMPVELRSWKQDRCKNDAFIFSAILSSSVESMSFDVDCWILSYKNVLFSAIISVAIFKQYSSFKTIFQYFTISSTTNFLPNISRFLFIFTIPSKSTFFELFLIAKHIQNTVRYEYTIFFYYRYIAITSLGDGEARNMGLDLFIRSIWRKGLQGSAIQQGVTINSCHWRN